MERHAAALTRAVSSDGSAIDRFIDTKLAANNTAPVALTDDYAFARRVYLDIWGLIPTADEVRDFVSDRRPDKRSRLIDQLIDDDRWADPWVAYFEDVLAENPVIFGEVPNSTGPFKQWIYRSFVEDRGYDRLATELILMEGTPEEGGTMGFRTSRGNDVPLAEKALVISQAFMGANMKCARCHDSPVNEYRQRDLFGVAAMLNGAAVKIPPTSSVGAVPGRRPPAVSVTSKPGDDIVPASVFDAGGQMQRDAANDHVWREALTRSLIGHRRFAEVGVNRIWRRFMGTGLVEPVDDWGYHPAVSHPELMDYLAREFVQSGYSVRHIERIILKTRAYQRKRDQSLAGVKDAAGLPLFAAQSPRRMGAEELVDSLHRAVHREFKSERMAYSAVDYGYPKRTWQIVSLSNEEDNVQNKGNCGCSKPGLTSDPYVIAASRHARHLLPGDFRSRIYRPQHFVRAARLFERQLPRDQGLDLALLSKFSNVSKFWRNHAGLNRINHWMLYGPRPGDGCDTLTSQVMDWPICTRVTPWVREVVSQIAMAYEQSTGVPERN
jgi:hypothetical protein